MKELVEKLTTEETKFICWFANTYITQIPYIDESSINGLNRNYLIAKIKVVLKKSKLVDNQITFANIVITKNKLK